MLSRLPFILLLIAILGAMAGPLFAESTGKLEPKVQVYFEQNCLSCHGPQKQKGDFRIDTLSPRVGFENTPQWLEVMSRISSGEMPPEKAKVQPTADES